MFLFKYFLLFIMFSFTGWVVEVLYVFKKQKVLVNRGFLFGPYLPIYGFVALIYILMLKKYIGEPIIVFIEGVIISFIIEYVTSYILEITFNDKWWDYKDKKYNINGRVCIENTIPFGIFAIICIYILEPLYFFLINLLNTNALVVISFLIFILYVVDSLTSTYINIKLKKINYSYNKNLRVNKIINRINNNNVKKTYNRY